MQLVIEPEAAATVDDKMTEVLEKSISNALRDDVLDECVSPNKDNKEDAQLNVAEDVACNITKPMGSNECRPKDEEKVILLDKDVNNKSMQKLLRVKSPLELNGECPNEIQSAKESSRNESSGDNINENNIISAAIINSEVLLQRNTAATIFSDGDNKKENSDTSDDLTIKNISSPNVHTEIDLCNFPLENDANKTHGFKKTIEHKDIKEHNESDKVPLDEPNLPNKIVEETKEKITNDPILVLQGKDVEELNETNTFQQNDYINDQNKPNTSLLEKKNKELNESEKLSPDIEMKETNVPNNVPEETEIDQLNKPFNQFREKCKEINESDNFPQEKDITDVDESNNVVDDMNLSNTTTLANHIKDNEEGRESIQNIRSFENERNENLSDRKADITNDLEIIDAEKNKKENDCIMENNEFENENSLTNTNKTIISITIIEDTALKDDCKKVDESSMSIVNEIFEKIQESNSLSHNKNNNTKDSNPCESKTPVNTEIDLMDIDETVEIKEVINEDNKNEGIELPFKARPLTFSGLANNLDILSDDEEEPQIVKATLTDSLIKPCINLEDDDDVMVIEDDSSSKDSKDIVNEKDISSPKSLQNIILSKDDLAESNEIVDKSLEKENTFDTLQNVIDAIIVDKVIIEEPNANKEVVNDNNLELHNVSPNKNFEDDNSDAKLTLNANKVTKDINNESGAVVHNEKVTCDDVSVVEKIPLSDEKEDNTSDMKPGIKAPLVAPNLIQCFRSEMSSMTRDNLEEFCLLKIVEGIVDRSNLSDIKTKLKSMVQHVDVWRKKAIMLTKQNRDIQIVLKGVQEEHRKRTEGQVAPLRISRSVGLQVLMSESRSQAARSGRARKFNNSIPPSPQTKTPRGPPVPPLRQQTPLQNTPLQNTPLQSPLLQHTLQSIPVPRLVPAPNITPNKIMKSPPPQPPPPPTSINNSGKMMPTQNGIKNSPTVQNKPAEKRPFSSVQSVTVDLTEDEPQPKQLMTSKGASKMFRVIPSQQLMQQRPHFVPQTINSPRKVYIPISGPQNQNMRPGQTVMIKSLTPVPNPRQRSPHQNNVRMPHTPSHRPQQQRLNVNKHPAPLPDAIKQPQPPNWKALPPAPDLKISKVENGIVVSWKIEGYLEDSYEEIASYQLYAYQETSSAPSSSLWKKIGDVKALPLPMACTLTQFMAGFKYYFAVRAVDNRSRVGPFSLAGSILLLNK